MMPYALHCRLLETSQNKMIQVNSEREHAAVNQIERVIRKESLGRAQDAGCIPPILEPTDAVARDVTFARDSWGLSNSND